MSPGYDSLKEMVQKTLQSKSSPLVRVKSRTASGINDELDELEKSVLDCVGRLKAAVKDGEAVVTSEGEHTDRVIEGLRANISSLEANLRETEDTVRRKDSASQRLEKNLNAKISELQSELKSKAETLESQSTEVKSHKAKIDLMAEQIAVWEQAVKKKKLRRSTIISVSNSSVKTPRRRSGRSKRGSRRLRRVAAPRMRPSRPSSKN